MENIVVHVVELLSAGRAGLARREHRYTKIRTIARRLPGFNPTIVVYAPFAIAEVFGFERRYLLRWVAPAAD
ncbi:MAG: hypothetical protein ABI589_09780 [Burkholderiales bacterium]